jgi:hypothetical protein
VADTSDDANLTLTIVYRVDQEVFAKLPNGTALQLFWRRCHGVKRLGMSRHNRSHRGGRPNSVAKENEIAPNKDPNDNGRDDVGAVFHPEHEQLEFGFQFHNRLRGFRGLRTGSINAQQVRHQRETASGSL